MRSGVRGAANITIAVFDGGNPYQNDRMKLITRLRTGAKSYLSWYSTWTMCVLNDSSLTWLANLKVSDLRELRQLADLGDYMIDLRRLLRTILENVLVQVHSV